MTPAKEPVELFSGRYTVFQNPNGGMHLAYLIDGDHETRHFDIPPAVIHAAKMAAEGGMSPLALLNTLRKTR